MTALAPTLQAFFSERLITQRHASAHTVAAYRDTWRLLLRFAAAQTGILPSTMDLAELDAPLIAAFLSHLEHGRGNSVRTRNARLAAIGSLFRFAALHHPEHAASIARVLAIPPKRFERALVTYLTDDEIDALLAAPDRDTWTGRRDHTLLLLGIQTGLRVSELAGLTGAGRGECPDRDLERCYHALDAARSFEAACGRGTARRPSRRSPMISSCLSRFGGLRPRIGGSKLGRRSTTLSRSL